MISKYTKSILLKKDLYAIYNSYILEPIFVNKNEKEKILSNNFDDMSAEEIKYLKKIGIVVNDELIDKKTIQIVKDSYKKFIENKITIMYLIPTNCCNLSCKYCFIGNLTSPEIKMKLDTAKRAVDLFAEHLAKINENGEIFFYGAEPLLNFSLIEYVVTYCKQKKYKIKFSMVSNGLLLNENIIEFIKYNKISLGISIDGPKEITNINRIYKNSNIGIYDDLIEKITMLKQHNVNFGLSITVAPIFLKSQDMFIEWLKSLNVKNISYNLLHFTKPNDEWKNYYKEAVKFIYKSNNQLFDLGFNEDRINRKYIAFFEKKFKFSDCGAVGGNQITICPDGTIEVCHGYWNNEIHKLPNINSINCLDDLFVLNDYNCWKNYMPIKKHKCINCPYVYICGGGCAMQSRDVFGSEKNIDKAFCIYTKIMMKYILLELYDESIHKNS